LYSTCTGSRPTARKRRRGRRRARATECSRNGVPFRPPPVRRSRETGRPSGQRALALAFPTPRSLSLSPCAAAPRPLHRGRPVLPRGAPASSNWPDHAGLTRASHGAGSGTTRGMIGPRATGNCTRLRLGPPPTRPPVTAGKQPITVDAPTID